MMIVGIGIDVLEIPRMERVLVRSGRRFLDRVFTGEEQSSCEQAGGGAARWAARFAAKEAVFKALGTGWSRGVTWRQVEILRSPEGPPRVRLTGVAGRLARARGVDVCHVSLTHERRQAAALVVLESLGRTP
ncbi:MAG: holo-ACP synthase [Acidobacteriota bacterium]